ncbi:hypothetical protein LUZ63_012733 [Rhynchospora breviuscula]|uniref:DEAD-box ATP-dependent RNA helicase 50 n=1 Tax=Rhynchospora breviuscula TaxID=2022672 RepID=A0A9Q0CLN7_9POAL|nr:hypothetical protein LUZ63_012733 [Rhynchospora breviuscula]
MLMPPPLPLPLPLRSFLTLTIPTPPPPPNFNSNSNRRRRATTCTTTCTRTPSPISARDEEDELCLRFQTVQLETPGAYRLLDRHTGRHVIFWGQAPPPPPSSSHLLLSSLSSNDTQIEDPTDRGGAGGAGFAKLKTQKVRSLIMSMKKKKKKKVSQSQSQASQSPIQVHSHVKIRQPKTTPMSMSTATSMSTPLSDDDDDDNDDDDDIASSPTFNANTTPLSTSSMRPSPSPSSSLRGWGAVSSSDYHSYSSESDHKGARLPAKYFTPGSAAFFSKKSFNNLGCTHDMLAALRSLSFLRPSHIQAMAFRAVLQGKSCIIADQSGSGKTLAYLCPLIQRLRRDEEAALFQGKLAKSEARPRCPRVVVLTPTAELASQVLNNCRMISKSGIPFRSMVATGGFKQKTQLETLDQGLDVLIATPGRFLFLYKQGFIQLSHLQCVVLDEVDILYGEEGFEQVLQGLISAAPVSVQYLFVTATLPVEIYNKVVEVFPDCEVIMGPGMHRTSSGLEEVLVDCSGDANEEKNPETAFANKKNALLKLIQDSPVRKTIVFCNKIETCRKVENVLKRVDRKEAHIRVLPFHSALTQDVRLTNLKEFLKSQSADSMFLVCTDRASRGIDFEKVDHVVLFDFPREPSEYVRRVGRTARGAGGAGKAFVFAVGKQVSLAGRIIERNRKGHPLHHVPGAYN